MKKFIQIHPTDNVAVAIDNLKENEVIELSTHNILLNDNIDSGHKFSLTNISKNESIVKYGNTIGVATVDIKQGEWVHSHNIKTTLNDVLTYDYQPCIYQVDKQRSYFFNGYDRKNGKYGVRNEIWIIPTVGCVNNVAQEIAKRSKLLVRGSVEDVITFPHPYGCSQMGDDQENTRKILVDLISHPNAGGVLVLGLGCENSNIDELKKIIGPYDDNRIKFIVSQDYEDEIEASLTQIEKLIEHASQFIREPIDARNLIVGLKCGGSDGFSGITANPTVGKFSDMLIGCGGTTILTEVPEMFGAETLLMNRCKNEIIFNKTVNLINDFKNYFSAHNQVVYENPSPGNKKGGISTLEDKSLGCTQKSGSAPIVDVLAYGEIVKENGLNLLSAPGNDLVASTALAASGAHIVLFTTGRGTPFASPVPTMKISSNTILHSKKKNWIDFDCGALLENQDTDISIQLFNYVLEIASGKKVCSEKMGYHDMAIFKQGVTL